MKTAEEMYASAMTNDLVGWPGFAFPLSFIAKKDFQVIEERMLLDNEEVIFPFMMLADTNLFDNRAFQNQANQNSGQMYQGSGYDGYQEDNNQNFRYRRHWTAFALTSRSHIYYGRWIPFNSDNGDMPVSSGDINVDIDQRFWFLTSELDISTLRKNFLGLKQKFTAIQFIRDSLIESIDSLNHHKDSEDGRRIYSQYANGSEENDDYE